MRTEDRGISVAESTLVIQPDVGENLSSAATAKTVPAANSQIPTIRYGVFATLATAGLVWDLWSKWKVFDQLQCPGQLPVWKGSLLGVSIDFELATTFNHGALWGIGQNQTWLFATLSFFAVGAICYFLWTRQAVASWWLTIASGLLLAGTLGNLYDRLGLHGWRGTHGAVYAVRDFLDFVFGGTFHWATFNFADTYLVTGAIMLVIQSFWTPLEEAAPQVTEH